jgi:cytoskeletal protein CcmA (bactofilin family)
MWTKHERVPSVGQTRREEAVACIGKSITIKGEVVSSEDLIVDGHVEGRIDLQGHSLMIGVGGGIRADIAAKIITIQGSVTGNVSAADKVEVRETGSVDGDIAAPRIAVFEGAVLQGRLETALAARGDRAQPLPVAV